MQTTTHLFMIIAKVLIPLLQASLVVLAFSIITVIFHPNFQYFFSSGTHTLLFLSFNEEGWSVFHIPNQRRIPFL